MTYGIHYRPGTTLAARFGDRPAGSHDTHEAPTSLLRNCVNAADMEVVELAALAPAHPTPEPDPGDVADVAAEASDLEDER